MQEINYSSHILYRKITNLWCAEYVGKLLWKMPISSGSLQSHPLFDAFISHTTNLCSYHPFNIIDIHNDQRKPRRMLPRHPINFAVVINGQCKSVTCKFNRVWYYLLPYKEITHRRSDIIKALIHIVFQFTLWSLERYVMENDFAQVSGINIKQKGSGGSEGKEEEGGGGQGKISEP